MSEAYKEVHKNCSTCLHKGLDGAFEPCQSCMTAAAKGQSHTGWKDWAKCTEEQIRKNLMGEGVM